LPDQQRPGDVAGVVHEMVALQAQNSGAVALQVRARGRRLSGADFESSLCEKHSIVRTWCLRGTLHVLAAQDARWMVDLLGRTIIKASEGRYRQLGINGEVLERAADAITETLGDGSLLTRADLLTMLTRRRLPVEGQAGFYLIRHAALLGLICLGPAIDGKESFVLLDEVVPRGRRLTAEHAIVRLARRYLRAYGPATIMDFTGWTGLGAAACSGAFEALANDLTETVVGTSRYFMLSEQSESLSCAPAGDACLLGAFDAFLLAYKDRTLVLDSAHARKVNAGGGIIRPVAVVDGRVVGPWFAKRKKGSIAITLESFLRLSRKDISSLEHDAMDLGVYIGKTVTFEVVGTP